jgi:membrane protein DedA with SNARE-associated domain
VIGENGVPPSVGVLGAARPEAIVETMFATLESLGLQIAEFVKTHEAWAPWIVFALAFGESLAFVSLVLPAWLALITIGGFVMAGGLNFWPIWIAAVVGAALGDWLSYWIGQKLGPAVQHVWPLSRHPDLFLKGEVFMKRWGAAGIFIGRFFGPLRAVIPLIAGIFEMPFWRFQIANFTSALVWAAVLLTIGDFAGKAIAWLWS